MIANLSKKQIQHITWTLLCLMPIVGMAIDLVAPSLPHIAISLQVSEHIAQNVIAIYLLGYALGNFFTGFLTDAWGRQKLIRIGLLSFILVSLVPVIYGNIKALLIARFLQGISLGAVAVLARAIFSDILSPEKLIRLGSIIGTMWGLGPVIGPIIGGYLQFYFGWKAGFIFFSIVATLGFVATFLLIPETHTHRHFLRINVIKKNLFEIITHRTFMCSTFLMGLTYSLIIIFNTAGPFLIQDKFNYSSIFFGHLALYLGLFFLFATFVCRYFLQRSSVEIMVYSMLTFALCTALFSTLLSYFFPTSIILLEVATALMFFVCGFIFPMSMGKGMSVFRHLAGTAAAVMYLINILITSLGSFLVGFVAIKNNIFLMWIYLILVSSCFLVYKVMGLRASN